MKRGSKPATPTSRKRTIPTTKRPKKSDSVTSAPTPSLNTGTLKISHKTSNRRRLLLVGISLATLILFASVTATVYGYMSALLNIYPPMNIGSKTVSLKCTYSGQDITVSSQYYSNVNNYYHGNARKKGLMDGGDLSKYVYANAQDKTINTLADKIRQVGVEKGFSDDQVLELATCFIQNIPYDNARASKILSSGNDSASEQYPYETLYKNSGICTDKTYLGSALLKELGYGTAIFIFPEDKHVALGVSAPNGYTEFSTAYTMMELTTPGFAPGELPQGIDDNSGKPASRINKMADLSAADNPASVNIKPSGTISAPTLVIDVNKGKQYFRIVAVKNLENSILTGLDTLSARVDILSQSHNELNRRNQAQKSAYSTYTYTPSTKQDCGYKYSYSYTYSYSSPYSYTSPYKYSCDTVSNPQKNYAYSSYSYALSSYNSQVDYYNRLVSEYNALLANTKRDIQSYKAYDYN